MTGLRQSSGALLFRSARSVRARAERHDARAGCHGATATAFRSRSHLVCATFDPSGFPCTSLCAAVRSPGDTPTRAHGARPVSTRREGGSRSRSRPRRRPARRSRPSCRTRRRTPQGRRRAIHRATPPPLAPRSADARGGRSLSALTRRVTSERVFRFATRVTVHGDVRQRPTPPRFAMRVTARRPISGLTSASFRFAMRVTACGDARQRPTATPANGARPRVLTTAPRSIATLANGPRRRPPTTHTPASSPPPDTQLRRPPMPHGDARQRRTPLRPRHRPTCDREQKGALPGVGARQGDGAKRAR